MNEILDEMLASMFLLTPPLATGVLLGAMFFIGLWWTVRRGLSSRRPGSWFICSMVLRMSLAVSGFHFLLTLPGSGWKTLAAGLLGFIIARLAATRLLPIAESLVKKQF
ncbi:ATP synthase subunit I [Nitrosovibrio tenuis]|uniref:F1/F0 ATPase, subunit 2 n=1 Tax=Nitrosovibrio tenuis TaxID=1233 RepID=A0A1H7I4X8_9PROT|nr:ATP synthase subunit I [Nitrosovibrio tenuis]SEK56520.1 F1/F0 ATPase, subunit 2 [Nitrosovibrio tenuis]